MYHILYYFLASNFPLGVRCIILVFMSVFSIWGFKWIDCENVSSYQVGFWGFGMLAVFYFLYDLITSYRNPYLMATYPPLGFEALYTAIIFCCILVRNKFKIFTSIIALCSTFILGYILAIILMALYAIIRFFFLIIVAIICLILYKLFAGD